MEGNEYESRMFGLNYAALLEHRDTETQSNSNIKENYSLCLCVSVFKIHHTSSNQAAGVFPVIFLKTI